jgi:hypothetical protein
MKLDKPTVIGFKYVGAGILAYGLSLVIVSMMFKYNSRCGAAAGMAVMSAMVMVAAREGYSKGRRASNLTGDSKQNKENHL